MLTAAKFYGAPSTPNARLLFRASLLHLPLFMAAFLAHRLPNTNADKAGLLLLNARRLGLGPPLEPGEQQPAAGCRPGMQGEEGEEGEEESLAGQALAAAARLRLQLPPLPFLPPLPLEVLLRCPSKASCEQAAAQLEDEEQQQQQQTTPAVQGDTQVTKP